MAGDFPPPPARAAGPASPRAAQPASRPAGPAPVAAALRAHWRDTGAPGSGLAAQPTNLSASPRPPAQQAGLHRARGERSRYVSSRERDSILWLRYPPAPFLAAANRVAPPPPRPSGYCGGAARRALSSSVGSCRPPPLKGAGARGALWDRGGPAGRWRRPSGSSGRRVRGAGPGSCRSGPSALGSPRRAGPLSSAGRRSGGSRGRALGRARGRGRCRRARRFVHTGVSGGQGPSRGRGGGVGDGSGAPSGGSGHPPARGAQRTAGRQSRDRGAAVREERNS